MLGAFNQVEKYVESSWSFTCNSDITGWPFACKDGLSVTVIRDLLVHSSNKNLTAE
jgi:hypothetical protein